ncbi:MAG: AraC family transcriptional regulator [Pseudomonadota bacterium]
MRSSFRHYRAEAASHSHDDFHQVIVADHGALDLEIEGRGGQVTGRQIAFIPAGDRHAFRAEGMNRFLVLDVDIRLAADSGIEALWCRAGRVPYLQASTLRPIRMGDVTGLQDPAFDGPEMTGFLCDLLSGAAPQISGLAASPIPDHLPPRLDRLLRWASARLADPVTVGDMARIAALSESALFAAFGRYLGTTPMRWLAEQRLRLAHDVLCDPHHVMALGEVAMLAGFQDQSAFSRAFVRRFGLSPRTLRQQARQGLIPRSGVSAQTI